MQRRKIMLLVTAGVCSALIFLGTFLIKISIPNGYLHFGDGFIYVVASLIPTPYAVAAAAIGGLMSDFLAGFAAYAPFTAIIKALMALAVSVMMKNNSFVRSLRGENTISRSGVLIAVAASVAAGLINCAGYFATDTILYGIPAAFAALPMNALQSGAGVAVFFVFLPIMVKAFRTINLK